MRAKQVLAALALALCGAAAGAQWVVPDSTQFPQGGLGTAEHLDVTISMPSQTLPHTILDTGGEVYVPVYLTLYPTTTLQFADPLCSTQRYLEDVILTLEYDTRFMTYVDTINEVVGADVIANPNPPFGPNGCLPANKCLVFFWSDPITPLPGGVGNFEVIVLVQFHVPPHPEHNGCFVAVHGTGQESGRATVAITTDTHNPQHLCGHDYSVGDQRLGITNGCIRIADTNFSCPRYPCSHLNEKDCKPPCIEPIPQSVIPPPVGPQGPPAPMGDAVWEVMKHECRWCHITAPYPAGIDLRTRTSVRTDQMQLMWNGVATEKAPAIQRLNQADKDSVLRWAVQNGAQAVTLFVPSAAEWLESTQIGAAANGTSAVAPGMFFGFAVEDSWVFGANGNGASPATIETYTDRDGMTLKGVALNMAHTVAADSFPASTKPSTYIVPNGVAYHGRFKALSFSGWVRFEHNTSIVVHQFDTRPLGRANRRYVRFELDRDWAAIHTTPTEQEVYPWITNNACPTDARMSGVLDKIDTSFYDDKWYYVTGTVSPSGNQYAYSFVVQTYPRTTPLVSLLGYLPADTRDVGGIAFHHYGPTTGGKPSMWAGFSLHVTSLVGAGSIPRQICKTCDLEAPE